jgi:transposase, IS6 family
VTGQVTASGASSVFAGFRFPREVISVAVRWYLRYGMSYWDVEELLAERGVTVDHVTIYRWVQRFTPEFIEAARPGRHAPGDRWFVDETYVKVAGHWAYLYRPIDQHGRVIDVLLSVRRDLAAARRFFTRAMRASTIPVEVTTDRAPVYARVLDELIPSALHTVEQYGPAPADARAKASPLSVDPRRRSRLCVESAPRPLRHRHRNTQPSQAPRPVRRPRNHHLTGTKYAWDRDGDCGQATGLVAA